MRLEGQDAKVSHYARSDPVTDPPERNRPRPPREPQSSRRSRADQAETMIEVVDVQRSRSDTKRVAERVLGFRLTTRVNRPNRGPDAAVMVEDGHGWVRLNSRLGGMLDFILRRGVPTPIEQCAWRGKARK